jgi:hypothetical protein
MILRRLQRREVAPRQRVVEIPPDPCNGAQLRAGGGQAHQAHVGLEGMALRRMGPPMVQPQEMQTVWARLCEGLDEEWEHLGVPRGQLQEEAFPRRRLDGTIASAPLEDMVHAPDWRHAARREASSPDRERAEATFVWATHPDGTRVRGGHRSREVVVTAGLDAWYGRWGFWWDGAGPR